MSWQSRSGKRRRPSQWWMMHCWCCLIGNPKDWHPMEQCQRWHDWWSLLRSLLMLCACVCVCARNWSISVWICLWGDARWIFGGKLSLTGIFTCMLCQASLTCFSCQSLDAEVVSIMSTHYDCFSMCYSCLLPSIFFQFRNRKYRFQQKSVVLSLQAVLLRGTLLGLCLFLDLICQLSHSNKYWPTCSIHVCIATKLILTSCETMADWFAVRAIGGVQTWREDVTCAKKLSKLRAILFHLSLVGTSLIFLLHLLFRSFTWLWSISLASLASRWMLLWFSWWFGICSLRVDQTGKTVGLVLVSNGLVFSLFRFCLRDILRSTLEIFSLWSMEQYFDSFFYCR